MSVCEYTCYNSIVIRFRVYAQQRFEKFSSYTYTQQVLSSGGWRWISIGGHDLAPPIGNKLFQQFFLLISLNGFFSR